MKVIHDLSGLSKEEIIAYLREVSTFIGLDPDLNALDTIWMRNENGPGQSLVVYARRGTAEILRNLKGIDILDLADHMVGGSIVFRAVGKDKNGRQEIATGSKSIAGLQGKPLDDAIMTASTRALRRVTMQFTTLGILDESEVVSIVGQEVNPAGSAQLAGSPMVIPQPQVPANNAPGKITEQSSPDVMKPHTVASYHVPTPDAPLAQHSGPNFKEAPVLATVIDHEEGTIAHTKSCPEALVPAGEPFLGRPEQVATVWKQHAEEQAAKNADTKPVEMPTTPVESTPSTDTKAATEAAKPKRARKPRGTVSLDGPEPEVVNNDPAPVQNTGGTIAPTQADSAPVTTNAQVHNVQISLPVPASVPASVPVGMPAPEQMAEYRKKVSVITAELPAGVGMGSVQRMRAFITKRTGAAPQSMTVAQWAEFLTWLDATVASSGVVGVIKVIETELA